MHMHNDVLASPVAPKSPSKSPSKSPKKAKSKVDMELEARRLKRVL